MPQNRLGQDIKGTFINEKVIFKLACSEHKTWILHSRVTSSVSKVATSHRNLSNWPKRQQSWHGGRIFEYLSYSLDLAPSEFYLFANLKYCSQESGWIEAYFATKNKYFFKKGDFVDEYTRICCFIGYWLFYCLLIPNSSKAVLKQVIITKNV